MINILFFLAGIALVIAGASYFNALVGVGLSTLLIPLLSIFLSIPQTLLVVAVIHWFSELWKILFLRKKIDMKLALLLGIPGVVGAVFGSQLVTFFSRLELSYLLGGALMAYGLFLVYEPRIRLHLSNIAVGGTGFLAGFSSGLFGLGDAIKTAAVSNFGVSLSHYLGTLSIVGIALDSTRIVSYILQGITLSYYAWFALPIWVIIALLAARYAPMNMPRSISSEKVRSGVGVFLLLAGARLVVMALMGTSTHLMSACALAGGLSQERLQEIIATSSKPVIIDFNASWCMPCKDMKPVFEELEHKLGGKYLFVDADVDEYHDLAAAHGVSSLPTFILLKDGFEVDRVTGGRSQEDMLETIENRFDR